MITDSIPSKSKWLIITALTAGVFLVNTVLGQDWYDTDWQFRRPVTIENPGSSPLSDFQVLVELDASFDFTKANADGSDIRVIADDQVTSLPFWIESWDVPGTAAKIWIKIPELPVAGAAVYIYYGNPDPVIPTPDPVETPPVGPFTRDAGNPIVPIGDAGAGANLLAENIVYDEATGHYWMVFANYRSGAQGVGLVWSDTPTDATSWTWFGNVYTHGSGGSFAPHIIKEDGTWYIFFAILPNIVYITATDIDGPYSAPTTVLTNTEPWEAYRVDEPFVFQRNDGTWIMMYMGDYGSANEQIGYATASNITGPYTKYENNPCIPFGEPGSYDAGTVADPWVYEFYGTYYIGYTVSPTTSSPWQTAVATTTDWQTFTREGIIFPLASTGWDAVNSFRGAVTRIGDTYLFSYTGDAYKMGIATQPVFMVPESTINSGDAVFDFFDGFEGSSLDLSKWAFANGDLGLTSVANGLLTLSATDAYVRINAIEAYGMDHMGETRAYHPDQGTQDLIAEVGFADISWNTVRIVDDFQLGTTYWQRQAKLDGQPDNFVNMAQTADQDWHVFHTYREGTDIAGFQIDDNPAETVNSGVPTMNLPPFLMSYGNGNEFVIDWTLVRKWAGEDPNTSVGIEEKLSDGIGIALHNTSCGKFEVRLKPDVAIENTTLTNVQFTLRWPANTVDLVSFASDYEVEIQGPVVVQDGNNYAVFVSATPYPVEWEAETEYTILSFAHDQTGTGNADFVIDESEWSAQNNGAYYVEIMGMDQTGFVYMNAGDVFLGTCGTLEITAYLEGPYNPSGGQMNTTLNTGGSLPLLQPYDGAPWNYPGTESVAAMPPDVVDWVLVELRDAVDAPSATPDARIDRQAALLLGNGSIVGTDGTSLPGFNNATLEHLFVVVWHRNHLGMMSASEVLPVSTDDYAYDFTTSLSQAYSDGQVQLDIGVYGMNGGDANADGTVDISDMIQVWMLQAGLPGYLEGDMNMDGEVNNPDKNDVWFWNFSKQTQVPE